MKKLKWLILVLVTLFMSCEDNNDSVYETPQFSVKDMISLYGEDYDDILARYPYAIIFYENLYMKIIYKKINKPLCFIFEFLDGKVVKDYINERKDGVIFLEDVMAIAEETNTIASLNGDISVTYSPLNRASELKQFTTYESFKQWIATITNKLEILRLSIHWNYGHDNPVPLSINYVLYRFKEDSVEESCYEFIIGKQEKT